MGPTGIGHRTRGTRYKDGALLLSWKGPAPSAKLFPGLSSSLGVADFTDIRSKPECEPRKRSVIHSLSFRCVSQNLRRQARGDFPSTVARLPPARQPSPCLLGHLLQDLGWRKLEPAFLSCMHILKERRV